MPRAKTVCAHSRARHPEQRYQRRHREQRETDVWMEMVQQVGSPLSVGILVHVGDRGADLFPFFRACLATQTHFVVRAAQNRRVQQGEGEIGHLLDLVRGWPRQDQQPFARTRQSWKTSQADNIADQFWSTHPASALE